MELVVVDVVEGGGTSSHHRVSHLLQTVGCMHPATSACGHVALHSASTTE